MGLRHGSELSGAARLSAGVFVLERDARRTILRPRPDGGVRHQDPDFGRYRRSFCTSRRRKPSGVTCPRGTREAEAFSAARASVAAILRRLHEHWRLVCVALDPRPRCLEVSTFKIAPGRLRATPWAADALWFELMCSLSNGLRAWRFSWMGCRSAARSERRFVRSSSASGTTLRRDAPFRGCSSPPRRPFFRAPSASGRCRGAGQGVKGE